MDVIKPIGGTPLPAQVEINRVMYDELPVDDPDYVKLCQEMLTALNGFPYPGDRTNGQLDLLRWMRAKPGLAQALLA